MTETKGRSPRGRSGGARTKGGDRMKSGDLRSRSASAAKTGTAPRPSAARARPARHEGESAFGRGYDDGLESAQRRAERPTPSRSPATARTERASDSPRGDSGAGKAPSRRAKPPLTKPSSAKSSSAKSSSAKSSPAAAPVSQKQKQKAAATETLATGVQTLVVTPDEADMRVDRFLVARFPQLAFTHIQRIVRKGELRIDGKRAKPNERLASGQSVRIPPLKLEERRAPVRAAGRDQEDAEFLKSITLYEDSDVMVLNKPMGLAVQGGSGTTRHVDGLLEALRDADGQKPRLVHRLDKDTAGCLVIAKTRLAAATLAKTFRSRSARKIYWALVAGVPRVKQGRISTYLAKEEALDGDARMRVARHGDDGASHAVTYYALVDTMAQKLAWLSLKPVTGRTHQLRAHTAHIGHPIVGDPKYFDIENWELPGGIQKKLHLLARRIVIPHPRTGKPIDVTAPLPPHMQQTWNLLGFDTSLYDPIVEAPEE
ncbi:Ribosomal large subunit pseudouridine synthase C [Chelatococcus asaccharovorans]|nr:Ribosomal large subunit pseudouridine synthase C [Chelatococcus asaccharovorans]CAH1681366.1 Ribosomal large subunit pseudouridine synthase C [Chelatococcus asaccharovorans]